MKLNEMCSRTRGCLRFAVFAVAGLCGASVFAENTWWVAKEDPNASDANAGTDDVFFGDFKAYKLNLAKGVEVKKSEEAAFRTGSAVYRAMTLADGKLGDTNAIVWCVATT